MTAFWGPYSSNLSSSASQSVSQSVAGRNKCVFQHSHELLKNSPPRTKPEKTFSHRNTHKLTAHIQPCRRMQQAALYNQLLTRTSDLLEPLGRKLETETIVFNFSPVPLLLLLRLLLPVAFRRSLTVASFHFFFPFCAKQQHFCSSGLEFLLLGSLFFRSFGLAACCALPTCSCVASSC